MFFLFGKKELKEIPKTLYEALANPELRRGSFEYFLGEDRLRPAKQQLLTPDLSAPNPTASGELFVYRHGEWTDWQGPNIDISWAVNAPIHALRNRKGELICLCAFNPPREGYLPIRFVFYPRNRIPKKSSHPQIVGWTEENEPQIVGFLPPEFV